MASSPRDLSESQRQILRVLANLYQEADEPVAARHVADALDRNPGTIRNKMPELMSLGVVESVAGPSGGYEPTEAGFAVLDRDPDTEREEITVAQGFDRPDVPVERIRLTNVHHPTECRAWVSFETALPDIGVGDPIVVGPTPKNDLVVAGEVYATTETDDRLLIDVVRMEAPMVDDAA